MTGVTLCNSRVNYPPAPCHYKAFVNPLRDLLPVNADRPSEGGLVAAVVGVDVVLYFNHSQPHRPYLLEQALASILAVTRS